MRTIRKWSEKCVKLTRIVSGVSRSIFKPRILSFRTEWTWCRARTTWKINESRRTFWTFFQQFYNLVLGCWTLRWLLFIKFFPPSSGAEKSRNPFAKTTWTCRMRRPTCTRNSFPVLWIQNWTIFSTSNGFTCSDLFWLIDWKRYFWCGA